MPGSTAVPRFGWSLELADSSTADPQDGRSLYLDVDSICVVPWLEGSLGHVRRGGAFWRLALGDSVQYRRHVLLDDTEGLDLSATSDASSGAGDGLEELRFSEDVARATDVLQCVLTLDKASLDRFFRQDSQERDHSGKDVDETNFCVILAFIQSMLEVLLGSPCVRKDVKTTLCSWMSRARLPEVCFVAVFCAGPQLSAPTSVVFHYNKCRSQRCHLLWSKGTWRGVTFTNDVSRNQRSVRKG